MPPALTQPSPSSSTSAMTVAIRRAASDGGRLAGAGSGAGGLAAATGAGGGGGGLVGVGGGHAAGQVLRVDEAGAGLAEALGRLALAEAVDVDPLFPDARGQTGEVGVGRDQAEAVEPARMQ